RGAEEHDGRVERRSQQRRLAELDSIEEFDDAFAALGYKLPPELVREVVELDHEALVNSVRIEPETVETLEKLKADRLKLGLVSNVSQLPELLHRDIKTFGIARFMDGVAFSSELGVRKPRPQSAEHVLDAVGGRPA